MSLTILDTSESTLKVGPCLSCCPWLYTQHLTEGSTQGTHSAISSCYMMNAQVQSLKSSTNLSQITFTRLLSSTTKALLPDVRPAQLKAVTWAKWRPTSGHAQARIPRVIQPCLELLPPSMEPILPAYHLPQGN
ncbi:uncharacterized protein LOC144579297 [Callithrix jacchus]